MPGAIDDEGYAGIRSFRDFDEHYTAPFHGFAGAEDYWAKVSSRPWLTRIAVPALMVNALDDPLLGSGCFPWQEAADNPCFHVEARPGAGTWGFLSFAGDGASWAERRAVEFVNSCLECEKGVGE